MASIYNGESAKEIIVVKLVLIGTNGLNPIGRKRSAVAGKQTEAACILTIDIDGFKVLSYLNYFTLTDLTKVFLKASPDSLSFLIWLLRATFSLAPKCLFT